MKRAAPFVLVLLVVFLSAATLAQEATPSPAAPETYWPTRGWRSITRYLPELAKRDPRFTQVTLRDLLMMSAGLRCDEDPPYHDNDVTYHAADLRRAALENTAIVDIAGKYWLYNNYHPLLLGMILERVTGMPVTAYMQEKLWGPLGMEYPGSWSINGDPNGLEKMESGINARSIDFAKFGRLMLNDGKWEGKQIVSQSWVEQAT